jgi:hypothetical protein
VKNKKRIAGFLLRTLSVRIGNRMITADAQIQLVAVEKGTIFGWTISGIYSHTIGPKDRPNTAIYIKRPKRIKACPGPPLSSPLMKKPIATNKLPTP